MWQRDRGLFKLIYIHLVKPLSLPLSTRLVKSSGIPQKSSLSCGPLNKKTPKMSGNIKRKATESPAVITKKARAITSFFAPLGAPSSSASADSAPKASTTTRPKFDKERWASKLSDEHKSLLQLEINTMEQSWFGALKDELITPEFLTLKRFLRSEKDSGKLIYPPEEDIYSWYGQIFIRWNCISVPSVN